MSTECVAANYRGWLDVDMSPWRRTIAGGSMSTEPMATNYRQWLDVD